MPNELLKAELRGGWLGVPEAYTAYDFLGFALGSYFIIDGVVQITAERKKKPNWWPIARIGLGAIMFYIHTQRFFYAPQSKEGLQKLLTALDINGNVYR